MKIAFSLFAWLLLSLANPKPEAIQHLHGRISDETGAPIIGAQIVVYKVSVLVTGGVTDSQGKYRIYLDPGTYRIEIQYVAHPTIISDEIVIKNGEDFEYNAIFDSKASVQISETVVQKAVKTENESQVTIRGARTDGTQYIIDAIRVTGNVTITEEELKRAAPSSTIYHEAAPEYAGEGYNSLPENAFTLPQNEPLSTFGADVDAASYANVRRFINQGVVPPTAAVRTEELINYFSYDYPQPKNNAPAAFTTELATCPWNAQHQLLHIGVQARAIDTKDLPASNLVFLIDVSGSMSAPDKLPLLKQAYRPLAKQLRPQDKISIAVYAGAAGVVLEPTHGGETNKILAAIDKLEAGGSTAGAAGILLAYQLAEKEFIEGGNNRVILATDGDFNLGTSSVKELEKLIAKKRESGVFLSVLGFGQGNYQDAKMQSLAEKGNGNAAYIDNLPEARKVLVEEFGGTLFTVAKDVKLQVEFNPAAVAAYRLIGYESRLLAPEDFNDDRKDAGDMGSGHTVTALYEIIPAGVESGFLPKVDKLNYQQPKGNSSNFSRSHDLATVRMKYKAPDAKVSQEKIEVSVKADAMAYGRSSENFRWSAAVAAWSLVLKESSYISKDFSYAQLLLLAASAKTHDEQGYRAECIRLMETTRELGEKVILVERN